MKRLLGQVVFTIGGRQYLWDDVWLASHLWGDWAELTADVREGLARLKQAQAINSLPRPEELTASANEFRYQRELLTAQETRAWLESWGLTLESWTGFIRRSLVRSRCRPGEPEPAALPVVGDEEVDQAIDAELVLSGRLARLCRKLAGRAAVYALVSEEPGAGAPEHDADADLAVPRPFDGREPVLPDGLEVSREKVASWARLEAVFRRFCKQAATAKAVRDCIRSHAVAWTRLECQSLGFPDEQPALEAAQCASQDGRSLAEVAAEAHVPIQEIRLRLDQVDAGLRARLRGARPGQVLGPLSWDGEFRLLLVAAKHLPSERDPETRRRAAREVVRCAVDREIETRVRWEARFRC